MKKLLLSIFVASSFAANAQVTILNEGFESYADFSITGFGGWLTVDLDLLPTYIGGNDAPAGTWEATWPNAGSPQAWMIFNPSTATGELENGTPSGISNSTAACSPSGENRNFDPHTGSKYAASWAAVPATTPGGNQANNDLLISPVMTLGTTNILKFWVKGLSSCYDPESYRVYVIPGAGTPTSLTGATALGLSSPSTIAWVEKTIAIPATFDGQQVRIAIVNNGSDHYMLMVDDFSVTAASLGVNDVLSSKFSVYPNPATDIINVTNNDSILVNQVQLTDLNGRVVKNVTNNGVNDMQINISDLSAGMYMMTIDSDQGKALKKIVKN